MLDFLKRVCGELLIFYFCLNIAYFLLLFLSHISLELRILVVSCAAIVLSFFLRRIK